MRIMMACGLLTAALMLGRAGHAQTWDNPLAFTANTSSTFDSCALPWQTLWMANGAFPISAPAVVYRVTQRPLGRNQPPLRPWSVALTPQSWADMSLWVCQQKSGDFIDQCVDGSDDYGNGVPEHVTVPAVFGSYYVIVTGNIGNQPPMCGQYMLTTIH